MIVMGEIELKSCSKCKIEKPASHEFFPRYKYKGKWRLHSHCKICVGEERLFIKKTKLEKRKKNLEMNKEKIEAHDKLYNLAIKERYKAKRERNKLIKKYYKQKTKDNTQYTKKWKIKAMENSPSNKTYSTLHKYIRRKKEIPLYCTICNEIKKLEICSIDHTYTEDLKDWIYLCSSCHNIFDKCRKKKGWY